MNAAPSRLARLEAVCPIFVEWARQEIRAENSQLEREQLARARGVGAGSGHVANADFGPVIRFVRQEIEPEFRADPNPEVGALVHGARIRDGLRFMFARKHITLQAWHAVCDFRDDIDIAAGARPDQPDRVTGIRSPYAGRRWPEDAQLEAMQRVRATWEAIPLAQQPLAIWCVISGGTLDQYAKLEGLRRLAVADMLQNVLEVVETHYGQGRTEE